MGKDPTGFRYNRTDCRLSTILFLKGRSLNNSYRFIRGFQTNDTRENRETFEQGHLCRSIDGYSCIKMS